MGRKKNNEEKNVFQDAGSIAAKYVANAMGADRENAEEKRKKILSGEYKVNTGFDFNIPQPSEEKTTTERVSKAAVGMYSHIGMRDYQQDAVDMSDLLGNSIKDGEFWLGILCDGMGGMNGGERASQLCVKGMMERFMDVNETTDITAFYSQSLMDLDADVYDLQDEFGEHLGAGSTLISVIIKGYRMYFASVGDSRISILRNGILYQMNEDHNYYQDLLKQVAKGNLTQEEADNDPHREALTSYMGIGCLEKTDIRSVDLAPGDFVILTSDGLYRSMSDTEIVQITEANKDSMPSVAEKLVLTAVSKGNPHQDNTSVIAIRID